MLTVKLFQRLTTGAAVLATFLVAGSAQASEVFPAAIQEAADMSCVPSCLLCHTSNPGSITTFQGKPFGKAMFDNGAQPQQADTLKAAYAKYAMANPSVAESLKNGIDPDNQSALCNGPAYGCGARIAKPAPSGDATVLFWVAGAMLTAGVVRRRRPKV